MILVACGLKREAAIMGRAGVIPVIGGGDAARLERALEFALTRLTQSSIPSEVEGRTDFELDRAAVCASTSLGMDEIGSNQSEHILDDNTRPFPTLILSSGVAGALDSSLKPGDVVIGGDPGVVAKLQAALPEAKVGKVIGIDRIASTVAEKQALFRETGALAVDMESHVAERVARKHGVPFGILRVISDSADETLPPAALVGMRPDGGVAIGKVLVSLLGQPSQLPTLIRTARHADVAFRALRRVYDVLCGGGVGGFDLRELPLDM
ncbi:phosphorylase [Sphingomonas tabacisoli]|uniref:Phosphorylase n=1 Tax=Sphingomonas tabacisoli TaxID=2249466 RepID=A0ABW4I4U1_9SPHN